MSLYDIPVTALDGTPWNPRPLSGQGVARSSTSPAAAASPGSTPTSRRLYRKYRDRGLVVLGFPCNQFMGQEPGGEADIRQFCSTKFDVTFPMFSKVRVNGSGAHPLYSLLKRERRGLLWTKAVKWNFTKFLVDRSGAVVGRYGPAAPMRRVEKAVVRLLG